MSSSFHLPAKFGGFLEHWRSLRTGEGVPKLPDFLDKPIPELQPYVEIVDIDSESFWTVRLSGTRLDEIFGVRFPGDAADLISDEAVSTFRRCYQELIRIPCGSFHHSIGSTSGGREMIVRAMALPLVRANGRPCVVRLLELGRGTAFHCEGR